MKKLILMSILIVTFALPMVYAARPAKSRPTVRLLQKHVVWFCVLYVLAVSYILPRMN